MRGHGRVLGVASAIAAVAVLPWLVWWSSLPDEVATHWGLTGDPNGHMSRGTAFVVLAGVAVALAAAVVALARLRATLYTESVLAFVGATIASASLGTVVANSDKTTWRDAASPFGFIILGVVLGVSAAYLVRGQLASDAPVAADGPRLRIKPGERVAWSGSAHSKAMVVIALATGALGGALVIVNLVSAVIVLVSTAVVAMFTSVDVVVSARGVQVHGPVLWPRMTIPLERISNVQAIDVHPLQWGGWGYRGSLRLFGRAAWVLRRGPGLRFDLAGGKVFVLTVDHADDAAAVLNGLRVLL